MKKIYLLLFSFLLSFSGISQEILTPESIYVHTDKNTYLPGEILWFKVYTVESQSKKPSNASAVSYISFTDEQGNEVLQTKVELNPKSSNGGSVFIPQNLTAGTYNMTAYTTLSKTSNQLFSKSINILNPFSLNETVSTKAVKGVSVAILPEGGNLVDNLPSKVGFKLVDEHGKGIVGTLALYADDKLELSATSNFLGMGNFSFTPLNTKKYTIKIKLENGKEASAQLPEIQSTGYVLRAIPNAENYRIEVFGSNTISKKTVVTVEVAGYKTVSHDLTLDASQKAILNLDASQIPFGTSKVTLSTENGIPVAERIIFRKPSQYLTITPELEKNTFKNRELINLNLSQNSSAKTDISIAVFKIDDITTKTQEDILSYLYLQKDLTGYVENGKHYFSDLKSSKDDIENLLLTQGWRKFKPQALEVEKRYHTLKIKFTSKNENEPIANQEAMLSIPGKTPMVYTSLTNNEGVATFYVKNLYGPKQLATKLVSGNSANIEILKGDLAFSNDTQTLNYSFISQTSYDEYAINTQVENIYHGKSRSQFLYPVEMDSIPFFGRANAKYNLDDYTRFVLMEEVLREYVKELNVRKNRDNFSFKVFDSPRGIYFNNDPLILLDGVPFITANEILKYDPLKVKSIEVVANKYFLGNGTYEGIINFVTYKNDLEDFTLDPSYNVFSYEGLQFEREFYSPEVNLDKRLPDNRSLLYWNPKLTLKPNEKSTLNFTTSDLKGNFIIDIQGLNSEGLLGASTLNFKVE